MSDINRNRRPIPKTRPRAQADDSTARYSFSIGDTGRSGESGRGGYLGRDNSARGGESGRGSAARRSAGTRKGSRNFSEVSPRDDNWNGQARTNGRPRKTRFGALMAVIICVGAVVCVSAAALIFSNLTDNVGANTPPPERVQTANPGGIPANIRREVGPIVSIIRSVDTATNTFGLYDIWGGHTFFATWTGSTDMRDRHGASLVAGQFAPGDIVDVRHMEGDSVLTSIRQNAAARTFSNITGVTVDMSDPALGRLTHGNTEFIFGEELVAVRDGQPFDIATLRPVDRVTLRTFQNVAAFVEITAGSASIDVIFNENIRGGSITIGTGRTGQHSRLEEDMSFAVSEGTHQVNIRGDNIENVDREVTVRAGQPVTIDLADVQFRSGTFAFTTNLDDIFLTVNDNPWDVNVPLSTQYGTFHIRATAFGHRAYENTFVLNQPYVSYHINMIPNPTPTPRPERLVTRPITFQTNVGGVAVYIDGEFAGATSDNWDDTIHTLTVQVEVGARMITLRKDGFATVNNAALFVNEDLRTQHQSYHMHPLN